MSRNTTESLLLAAIVALAGCGPQAQVDAATRMQDEAWSEIHPPCTAKAVSVAESSSRNVVAIICTDGRVFYHTDNWYGGGIK